MDSHKPAKVTSPIISLSDGYVKTIPLALIVGAVGLVLSLALGGFDTKQFLYIYLTNFCFVLTIGLGCLFFVIVMHLTRAGWSVTVRRIAELFAICLVPMFILCLPILVLTFLGSDLIYSWNTAGWSEHSEAAREAVAAGTAEASPLEKLKSAYLNPMFFSIRVVAYFVIWGLMAWFFLSNSLKQDKTGDHRLSLKMQKFSAPIMILFAVTLVFSSFDFEMSLGT